MRKIYIYLLCFFVLVSVCGKVEAQPTINIDPSFDIGTGFTGLNSSVQSIALQPDGKILAGGQFSAFNGTTRNRLVRLNSDGTLDTSFYVEPEFDDFVTSVTLQPDGKILVGGNFTTFNGTAQNRIARLNSDGTLDTSFNIGTGFNDYVISVTLQPDGKILAGGHFTTYNGITQNRLVRLNSDGTLDTSFDLGTGFSYGVISITLQPDGKILVGGSFGAFNGTTQNRITRLNSDGTLDTSFNIGTGINGYYVSSIALQPDGKILVGGNFTAFNGTTQNKITRLNSEGTLDTSFNPGTELDVDGAVFSIILQPDGKILVGGSFWIFSSTTQHNIVRLNPDGTLDTCFNTGLGFHGGDYASWVYSVVLQPDGKISVGGLFKKYNGTTQNRITRLQELACEIIPPTPTVEVYHPNCYSPTESGSIIVTNPLGNQYQYSINGIDYQENTDFNNLSPGTYQVTVKEGCCISELLEVVINFAPIFPEPLEVEVDQPTCNNPYGSIKVLTFTFPAGTYSINGGEDYQYSPMFENLLPGTYQVIFKSGYGICVTEIMEVTINPVPNVLPTPEAVIIPIICSLIPEDIGTLVVTYPLGDEYEYSIDGVNYQSSPVFPNAWVFGTFQLTIRQGSCISEPLEFSNIEQSTVPIADGAQPDCSDVPETGQLGTITVTFPLGEEFQYSIDGENYQDSPVFDNLPPDTYALTFRYNESENCVSDPFEVSIFTLDIPDIPTVIITQPTCENPFGSIEVTSPFMDYPPYTYSINGEDYQFSPFFENLSPGIYQLTAQLLVGGCPSDPLEVNIHFPPAIPDTPTVIIAQPDCYNPFGSITITSPLDEGNEFTPNYEYSINGVDYYEFTLFDNLPEGSYYVTVRHLQSGCVSDPLEVIINELPDISVNLVAICENENHFVLKAETQEQNYQYVWNTGETTSVDRKSTRLNSSH